LKIGHHNKRMPPYFVARLRLGAFWLSIACRLLVYIVVTVLAIKSIQNGAYSDYRPGVLTAWLAICSIPALLLTPLIGSLAGSRWNRIVAVAGTCVLFGLASWAVLNKDVLWLSVLGVISLEAAFFVPTALAMIVPLSARASIQPVKVRWLTVLSLTIGALAAVFILNPERAEPRNDLIVVGVVAVSLAAIIFARTQIANQISLKDGFVKPFATGVRDVFRHRRAWTALIGLAIWFFVFYGVVAVLLRVEVLAPRVPAQGLDIHGPDGRLWEATWWFGVAILVGVLISRLGPHPFRHGGFAFYAAVLAVAACIWLRFSNSFGEPVLLLGMALGLAISPLINAYQTWSTPRFHGVAGALLVAVMSLAAMATAVVALTFGLDPAIIRSPFLNLLLATAVLAVVGSTTTFLRPAIEMTAAFIIWPIYRAHAFGPGVDHLPARGPCLVIGNHAAWFDPLFLAKVIRMPTTPMMTSKFYDLPVLSWIMRHVIGTIRVPDLPLRHEAPELKEAVAALDRNECVVLFPEGYLRRKEEVPLRRFGRGAWKILVDRPNTPVFACWIEGSWGSFFSHRGGPPTKGKRFDFWRPIRIGIVGPIKLDAAMLADHMATRMYLMQQVAAARAPLGLEPLDLQHASTEEENE
jgi:1-acyl-sn-glycerol-3-phosphate acyltransferase